MSDELEEHYKRTRREMRQERKEAISRDRSKYKKTDRTKWEKRVEREKKERLPDDLKKGLVVAVRSDGIEVESEGTYYLCRLRGLLKKAKKDAKTLVAVGDRVLFQDAEDDEGYIAHVEPRRTQLARADNLSRRKQQIIAANVDQVIISCSLVAPLFKPYLIDRYLIAAEKGGLNPIVVVNKLDLLEDESEPEELRIAQKELLESFQEAYGALGVPVLLASLQEKEGLDAMREVMKDRITVFSGQSGVGKSSIIRELTGTDLDVADVVSRTRKGSHCTTFAQLLPLPFGGWCVDTPGIKSFGVWDLDVDEIEPAYRDIHEVGHGCHYANCTHIHEPDCAVRQAVEEGTLSRLRYESYLQLRDSVIQKHLRR